MHRLVFKDAALKVTETFCSPLSELWFPLSHALSMPIEDCTYVFYETLLCFVKLYLKNL